MGNRGSVVGRVAKLRVGRFEVSISAGARNFSFLKNVQTGCGAHPVSHSTPPLPPCTSIDFTEASLPLTSVNRNSYFLFVFCSNRLQAYLHFGSPRNSSLYIYKYTVIFLRIFFATLRYLVLFVLSPRKCHGLHPVAFCDSEVMKILFYCGYKLGYRNVAKVPITFSPFKQFQALSACLKVNEQRDTVHN
jgi:hypothetical protein